MPHGRGIPAVAGWKPPLSTARITLAADPSRPTGCRRARGTHRVRLRRAGHGSPRSARRTPCGRARQSRATSDTGSRAARRGGLRQALQEQRHRPQVGIAQVLRAAEHHLRHRAERRSACRHAGLEQVDDCCVSQSATLASAGLASDGAYHLSIGLTPPLISSDPRARPEDVAPAVAGVAVAQPAHQVAAAVPFGGAGAVGLMHAGSRRRARATPPARPACLYGKRSVCARFGCSTAGSVRR